MREALIQRLRNLAGMIPHRHTLPSGADTVICSLEAFMQIKELAGEAADALENDVEIPIYDQEEIHHGCTVQVLYSSYTGDYSVGWWKEGPTEEEYQRMQKTLKELGGDDGETEELPFA